MNVKQTQKIDSSLPVRNGKELLRSFTGRCKKCAYLYNFIYVNHKSHSANSELQKPL